MKLVHYSNQEVHAINAPSKPQKIDTKPCGLWVSDDSDTETNWRAWCVSEGFRLDCLTHVHDLVLAPHANVVVLRSSWELTDFHRRFAVEPEWARGMRYPYEIIDWREVADRWDGIVITPYIWSMRLEGEASRWYYGWDCASGCI